MRGSLLRYVTFNGENNVSEIKVLSGIGLSRIDPVLRLSICHFHSFSFLLSMRGAKIYDLGENPVGVKRWTQLADVRLYYELKKA